jgi:hypothetical protein
MVNTVLALLVPSSTRKLRPMVYVISYIMSNKPDLGPLNKLDFIDKQKAKRHGEH